MKRLISLLCMCFMLLSMSLNVSAATSAEERPYFIINGKDIIYYGEDYENPETGEYFKWITNMNA